MDPAAALEAAVISRQQVMNSATATGDSDIQKFYHGSTIFVTGGTGFLGKHLIEKLFRSCKIFKMYVLMRSKKGKNIRKRFEEMLRDPVFNVLHKRQELWSSRVVCVEGDVAELRLGLSERDWHKITQEVEVIFHIAATTKFDESLRVATVINVRGTREVLLLAKECNKLKSFVHVSTAYSHATTKMGSKEVHEQFYPCPVPPQTLISMVETMEDERLNAISAELIKDWPNTYTFAKAVAEEAVRTVSTDLPICIVRPAIVTASYVEPTPGWLDVSAVFGASGLILGSGLGALHVFYVDSKTKLGLIPCDYVNNAIIVAGRETAVRQTKGGDNTTIYNISSVKRNVFTLDRVQKIMKNECREVASPMAVNYCYSFEFKHYWVFSIFHMLFHLLPAYMVDFICLLIGRQRRAANLAKKFKKMSIALSHFMHNEWLFVDNNVEKLYNNLSTNDKKIFNFDVPSINWTEYMLIWCIGIRKYILKDGLKSTEYAIKKQFWLQILNIVLGLLFLGVVVKMMICIVN